MDVHRTSNVNFVVFYVNFVRRGARWMKHDLVDAVVAFSHQAVHVRTAGAHVNRQFSGAGFLRRDNCSGKKRDAIRDAFMRFLTIILYFS